MTTNTSRQRILLTGHRSFAARGLPELLRAAGHDVTCFSRGPIGLDDGVVTGPILHMADNPHLAGPFDTVINYILLKDDAIAPNIAYINALLELCRQASVKHLLHISSVSSYDAKAHFIDEQTRTDPDPANKGPYGGLKVATDLHLLGKTPSDVRLTLLRPGFILGPGLINPIIGMGVRFGAGRVLLLGSARNHVPVTTRDIVNRSVVAAVGAKPQSSRQILLVVDSNSPTRREYLKECCTRLGIGTRVAAVPTPLWLLAAAGGEVVLRLLRAGIRPYRPISAACRRQTFDARRTEGHLGMSFACDWRQALSESMDRQQPNFTPPHRSIPIRNTDVSSITFIGFGGIVKQKHLPGLKRIGFNGEIRAYDLQPRPDEDTGITVAPVNEAQIGPAGLHVVASPGQCHNQAIALLRDASGPILVEKPLCYTPDEFAEWRAFDDSRAESDKVFVLHNSRFKPNVLRMLEHLTRYNPGALLSVDVHFQSPPVSLDSPGWRRAERACQTLLLDYAVHYLDLACMFNTEQWSVSDIAYTVNKQNQTDLIQGRLHSPEYPVSFVLRQGFMPRRARILFTFQNYLASLAFYPDTFTPLMGSDFASYHASEATASLRGTLRKVYDKLTSGDADLSHPLTFLAATGDRTLANSIRLDTLTAFYRVLFHISSRVYQDRTCPSVPQPSHTDARNV